MRRFALMIAATSVLIACGSSRPSQASNSAANGAANVAASAAVAAAPVSGAKAAAIMHERHEGMEAIGKANKQLRRELGASAPDLAAVRAAAAKIAGLAAKSGGWFPAGTGPEVGKTGAKPEIWQDPKDFAAKLATFQRGSQAFDAAARSGNLDAIHARFTDLGGTCKSCHDKYRSEMHH
ncbi:MAG: cytochrome c [Sphingomicrobium sp.]